MTKANKRKMEKSSSPASGQGDTKERIIAAAVKLFSSQGYDGTSTKQICEAAQANIAALHYHFESKEKMYLSILEKYGAESLGSALRTLSSPASDISELKVRLEMFLHETLELWLKDLDLVRLVQKEVEAFHPRSHNIFLSTFAKMGEALVTFFVAAGKKNLLDKDVDPKFAASAIFAQLSQGLREEKVRHKLQKTSLQDMNYRKKWVSSVVQMLLNGVLPRSV